MLLVMPGCPPRSDPHATNKGSVSPYERACLETGVFMLLYLDLAYNEMKKEGRMKGMSDLKEAIDHGAVKRVRPKVMTVGVMFVALFPIMWSTGTGADVMKRIAAPMIGGIFTSFILELLVYPAIYKLWKWHTEVKHVAV